MTQEQTIVSNAWARGSDWYPIRKVRAGKWIIVIEGYWEPLGTYQPNMFKTKTAAIDFFSNLCLLKIREWRGL
jgi:hypothetical protein